MLVNDGRRNRGDHYPPGVRRLKPGLWALAVAAAFAIAVGAFGAAAGTATPQPTLDPVPSSAPQTGDPSASLSADQLETTTSGKASTVPVATFPVLTGPALADNVDLPDPYVLRSGSVWWVYATGGGNHNLQVASSADLRSWGPTSDPLPVLPGWAAPGFTWAPAVLVSHGRFLLFYTAREARLGRPCISVAVSLLPAGPFTDGSKSPLICQTVDGGSIDPDPFVAPDGTAYLLWKSDDNGIGARTRIGGQRLSSDGLSLIGPRPRLLTADAPWQRGVIEGPAMLAVGGRYYLFYGANHWDTAAAAIGYAVCASPLGPCNNASVAGPWLASQGPVIGPSGPDPFVDSAGNVRFAFHAWISTPSGQSVRALWIGSLSSVPGAA
jgi:hypothetical protein